jgi:hypothetical protein
MNQLIPQAMCLDEVKFVCLSHFVKRCRPILESHEFRSKLSRDAVDVVNDGTSIAEVSIQEDAEKRVPRAGK